MKPNRASLPDNFRAFLYQFIQTPYIFEPPLPQG